MRRLTVVQLLPALEAGGVERSTLEIAEALVRAGHRAIVVSNGGRMLPQLQALPAQARDWSCCLARPTASGCCQVLRSSARGPNTLKFATLCCGADF